jgi:hypothetical protein
MKHLGTSAVSVIVCLWLAGCGQVGSLSNNGQSDAYNLGYSQALDLDFERMDSEYAAYAFCTTIAQNLFSTSSEHELNDYINGCMEFVLTK